MRQGTRVRSIEASRCLLPIAAAGVLLLCALATAAGQGPEVKVIELEIGDNMRFTPSVIDAQPGEHLRVVLEPVGKIKALGHNFIVLKAGTEPKAFVDKAADATEKTGAIPCDDGRGDRRDRPGEIWQYRRGHLRGSGAAGRV